MNPTHLANKLAKISKQEDDQEGMDLAVAQVDEWLRHDQPQQVEKLLGALKPEKLSAGIVLAVVSAVQPWRRDVLRVNPKDPRLHEIYAPFFLQCRQRLEKLKHDATELLGAWS